MAQPTVTARPAAWAGTSGPMLYKFTSTNYANAGYRMEIEIWDAVSAAKIADALYYANSAGKVVADVSAFIKSILTLDNESDLTTETLSSDSNWTAYYIKYQEVWTASSESQVDDVSNTLRAIYGGRQIGSTNTMSQFVLGSTSQRFLTLMSGNLQAVKGYPITFSMIGLTSSYLRVDSYLSDVLQTTSYLTVGANAITTTTGESVYQNEIVRTVINEAVNDRINIQVVQGEANTWTNGGVVDTGLTFDSLSANKALSINIPDTNSQIYYIALSAAIGEEVTILVHIASSSTGGDVKLDVKLWDATKSFQTTEPEIDMTYNGLYVVNVTSTIFAVGFVEVRLRNATGGIVASWEILSVESYPNASELKQIDFNDACDNIIMLQWKNSLGGDECFPFQINQEYTWHYSDRKAKRLTLYAENLTLSQWEAIQGLNTLGELYKVPITEMTTSVNRSMATIGQSVYVLNSGGTKIGVNVIGQPNTTFTKRKKHSATVIIEYPELFLQ